MSFKLTAAQDKELDRLIAEARGKLELLNTKIAEFNARIEDGVSQVEEVKDLYTEALESVQTHVESLVHDWTSEWDDKSERWQEGDKGSAVKEWIDNWVENASSLGEPHIIMPDKIEEVDDDLQAVEELPRSASDS